jgi:16S rRNA processing protein RimM
MSAQTQQPDYVIVGRITKPHGVRGAVKVEPITDDPSRFSLLQQIHIGPEDNPGDAVDIDRVQFQNKFVILSLATVHSREAAEGLRGQYLHIPADQALDLPDGSVYLYDLIGLEVFTSKNEFVGTVKDYLEYPANDMFVIEHDEREFLIPDVPDIVEDVDLDTGKIIINPIDGLLD